MNKNLQNLIDNLKSGKYIQHKGSLRSPDGTAFCFMGVAYDLSNLGTWVIEYNSDEEPFYYYHRSTGHQMLTLYNHLGLNVGSLSPFIDLNDEGVSFEEIANQLTLAFGGSNACRE
jgi:hypothetical protein